MLGEIILTDAVMIMNFEDHKVFGVNTPAVTQCQWMNRNRCIGNVAPQVDDGEPSAIQNPLGICLVY